MTRIYLIPALALLLSAAACKKDAGKSPGNGNNNDTTNNTSPTSGTNTSSGKKGADFSTNMAYGTWNGDIVALKASWYYTWGTPLPSPSPQNCEFVSMFWGASDVTAANVSAVQQLKAQGKVKYVLGFNEPNRADQVLAFMQRLLPRLESLSFVQRYSWFSGDPKDSQLWSSALIDAGGNLTALDKWYAGYQPNNAISK
jgi:hypothetical protein